MYKKQFKIGLLIGVISMLLFTLIIVFRSINSPTNLKLNMHDLTNKKVEVKNFRQKPLVINFWATWCAPCIKEFKIFDKVNRDYNNKVKFVMLSDESFKSIIKFKETHNYNFIYLKSTSQFSEYGLNSRPATYFYNKNGELIDKIIGSISEKQLHESIKKITE